MKRIQDNKSDHPANGKGENFAKRKERLARRVLDKLKDPQRLSRAHVFS